MSKNPRLSIKLTPIDKISEAVCWIFVLLTWFVVLLAYRGLSPEIPTHFGFSGIADAYGPKKMLLILPPLLTGAIVLLTVLNRFPHLHNYLVTITEENAERQYSNSMRLVRVIKLSISLVFLYLSTMVILISKGIVDGLGNGVLPIIVLSILATTGYFIIRSFRSA